MTKTPNPPTLGELDARRERAMTRLLEVFTLEQVDQLAEVIQQTHDLAVLRGVRQAVTVIFNEKGLPRQIDATNNFAPVKPKMYSAE